MLTVRRRRPRCAFPLKSPSASRPCTSRSRFYLLDYHLQASHPFASFNFKHGSCISVHLLLCQQPFTCLSNTAICILYPAPSTMQQTHPAPWPPTRLNHNTVHCTLEQMSSARYRSKSASAGDPRLEQTRLLFGSESELLIAAQWPGAYTESACNMRHCLQPIFRGRSTWKAGQTGGNFISKVFS